MGFGFHFFILFFWGMCKRNNIFYQRNIRLMFGHVNNMCKRSNIFYERNIKLAFAYVNSMCKSSNIFYMNETSHLCSRTGTTCSSVAAYSVACHRTILFRPHPTPSLTLHYVGVQVPRNAISPIPPHPMLLILFYVSTQCFMHVDMYTQFIPSHAHSAWLKISSKPRVKRSAVALADYRCLDQFPGLP